MFSPLPSTIQVFRRVAVTHSEFTPSTPVHTSFSERTCDMNLSLTGHHREMLDLLHIGAHRKQGTRRSSRAWYALSRYVLPSNEVDEIVNGRAAVAMIMISRSEMFQAALAPTPPRFFVTRQGLDQRPTICVKLWEMR
jgi:hypothetical protein